MIRFIAVLLVASSVFAQETPTQNVFNVFGSIGAGFKTGGQLISSYSQNSDGAIIKREDNYLNYGQGFKIDLGAQYYAMENLALQASFGMSFGIPSFEIKDRVLSLNEADSLVLVDSNVTYKRNMYGIKIMAVPRFEVLELIYMYTGVGIGFFWNSLHYETTRTSPTETKNEEGRIISSPTLGLTGMLGADFPVSDIFSIFGEIAFEQLSFKWKERRIEKTNIIPSRVGTVFYNEDDPNNAAPYKVPGSNWQIRIGLRANIL